MPGPRSQRAGRQAAGKRLMNSSADEMKSKVPSMKAWVDAGNSAMRASSKRRRPSLGPALPIRNARPFS